MIVPTPGLEKNLEITILDMCPPLSEDATVIKLEESGWERNWRCEE
jgi:hypothetical protein